MESKNEILIIKKTNKKILFASDIRNISYVLSGIETLHKFVYIIRLKKMIGNSL
jgi:hypothetical protein